MKTLVGNLTSRLSKTFSRNPVINKDYEEAKLAIRKDIENISELIKKEENWCQHALAKDINNIQLFDPSNADACKFCILGAAYRLDADTKTLAFLNRMSYLNGYNGIDRLNDQNNFEDVQGFLLACLKSLK